jgi:hypothetical protein
MEVLLALAALVLLAVLILPDGVLAAALEPTPAAGRVAPPEADPEPGLLLTPEFVQRRLDALTAELDRLDDDPGVMARGFRTTVARSAIEALRADAAALRADRRSAAGPGAPADVELELL